MRPWKTTPSRPPSTRRRRRRGRSSTCGVCRTSTSGRSAAAWSRASTTTRSWARRRATRRCCATTCARSSIRGSRAIEWQCGYRYREYFKQYPVFVFPSRYADPRGDEDGSYIHWISVIDPARRTEMIMQGIAAVHHYEGRGLKAALERREGLAQPAQGRVSVLSDTMWVDAPIEHGARAARRSARRSPRGRRCFAPSTPPQDRSSTSMRGASRSQFAACELGDYVLIEQDYAYPDLGAVQRCPIVLVPCARAFGPDAPGFLLHRIAFVRSDGSQAHGRTTAAELTAESMAIKRMLEARAGNLGQLRSRDELSARSRQRPQERDHRGAAGHLRARIRRRSVPALSPHARRRIRCTSTRRRGRGS